jgi:hypothetical protein
MRHETIEDYEGVGLYERLDRGPRLDDEFRYGVYQRVGMGASSVPGMDQLLASLLDTEEKSGLVAVKNDKKQYAVQGLELLTFQRTSAPGADPMVGQASYVLGTVGSPWVKQFVLQGFMVMVATATVPSGNVAVMVTSNPETIATYATQQGGFAMVDGPAELAVAATNFKASQQQPPTCPGGQAWAPALNQCVPIPGGVENQAAAAKTGTPNWLILGGVALAVVAVGALVLKS